MGRSPLIESTPLEPANPFLQPLTAETQTVKKQDNSEGGAIGSSLDCSTFCHPSFSACVDNLFHLLQQRMDVDPLLC